MPILAGQKVTADEYNADVTGIVDDTLAADETITTSLTDVTGVSIAFTTDVANTKVLLIATCDIGSTGNSDIGAVTCVIDGVTLGGNAKWQVSGRGTISQTWISTVAAAGPHTAKLQKQKFGTSNTVTLFGTHTKLTVLGNGT